MTHNVIFYILAGLAGGIMGGMGLGGGTLLIPVLTLFLDVNAKQAAAINLISFIPMSIIACVIHAKNKLLDIKKALLIAIPASATCALSSFAAQKIPSDGISKGFAVFLICLASVMLVSRAFSFLTKIRALGFHYPAARGRSSRR